MTVEQLIEKLKMYNPQAPVVLGCEHSSTAGHEILYSMASTLAQVVLVPKADYIDTYDSGMDDDAD